MKIRKFWKEKHSFLSIIILFFILMSPGGAFASDPAFKEVVKRIESQYQVKRTRIPFLGVAGLLFRVARPYGVKSFKLAVFENQNLVTITDDTRFEETLCETIGERWCPLARVVSRRSGERIYIFAKPNKKDFDVLIVALESNEAIVVQARVNIDKLAELVESPKRSGNLWKSEEFE